MKVKFEFTHNDYQYIELETVIVLNKQERAEFAKHGEVWGADFCVSLPFCGMRDTTLTDFMETGEITLSQWQNKDCRFFEGDEVEIGLMENMMLDDLVAVKRLAKARDRRQSKPSWMAKDFWEKA